MKDFRENVHVGVLCKKGPSSRLGLSLRTVSHPESFPAFTLPGLAVQRWRHSSSLMGFRLYSFTIAQTTLTWVLSLPQPACFQVLLYCHTLASLRYLCIQGVFLGRHLEGTAQAGSSDACMQHAVWLAGVAAGTARKQAAGPGIVCLPNGWQPLPCKPTLVCCYLCVPEPEDAEYMLMGKCVAELETDECIRGASDSNGVAGCLLPTGSR